MDDSISRQAAIDLVESFYKIDKSVLNIMVFKIKQLPSVQPRKGKWISGYAHHGVEFKCSVCGETTVESFMYKPRWNFCPMCGADMRGDEKMNKDIIEKSFQEWEEKDAKKLDVGGRIAKILCERKMTQRELAQKCHITEVSMSRYINNDRMPKGTVIVAVAKALGVSADYLLGMSDMRGDNNG